MSVRVYVPATMDLLREWHAAREVPASVERVVAPGDDEESEYAALMTAADLSTALLAGAGRRVVVVGTVDDDAGAGAVRLRDLAAVHADPAERPHGSDPDEDLAWYAVQEIPQLLAPTS